MHKNTEEGSSNGLISYNRNIIEISRIKEEDHEKFDSE
jgi:hypothetical protein